MPRAPLKIRKRFIEGETVVLDWELEEALLYGQSMFGPVGILRTREDWQREWATWGGVILPKALEHRPGTRPFALYAIGEIEPRALRMPLPPVHGYTLLEIGDHHGRRTTHYLTVPEPYIENEARYLHRMGIIDAAEMKRHREWMRRANPECDTCAPNSYPLEMSVYQ